MQGGSGLHGLDNVPGRRGCTGGARRPEGVALGRSGERAEWEELAWAGASVQGWSRLHGGGSSGQGLERVSRAGGGCTVWGGREAERAGRDSGGACTGWADRAGERTRRLHRGAAGVDAGPVRRRWGRERCLPQSWSRARYEGGCVRRAVQAGLRGTRSPPLCSLGRPGGLPPRGGLVGVGWFGKLLGAPLAPRAWGAGQ